MTDAEVIAAIRANHLKASWPHPVHWDQAWVDPGGTIWGEGPYLKVPVGHDGVVVRVYPPERLRKRLNTLWMPSIKPPRPRARRRPQASSEG